MNDVYFACMQCLVYVDAGYRWAAFTLPDAGVQLESQIKADAVDAAHEYWNPPDDSNWLRDGIFPAVRKFLKSHGEHELFFGEHESFANPDSTDWFDWLEVSEDPNPSPRFFAETLGLVTWSSVRDWVKANRFPWWWSLPEYQDSARTRFEAIVRRRSQ
ncbi:MAG: hypothetical protein H6510_14695 [Acidobacteria bacterium]|nr:hypothetical protein [Acidobacteriota bacterium]MCB9399060.1 hypothetical protein [Acidobacteriota bacterium]